jgi:mannose-6-phosphate isomerase-like protein (cupin superfamily)
VTFATRRLSAAPDLVAPDGSDVRILLGLSGGSMAHFTLAAGETSMAVGHHTVEEIWFVVSGRGEMWRKLDGEEQIVTLEPGVSLTIPRGAHFQFRTLGGDALTAVAVQRRILRGRRCVDAHRALYSLSFSSSYGPE